MNILLIYSGGLIIYFPMTTYLLMGREKMRKTIEVFPIILSIRMSNDFSLVYGIYNRKNSLDIQNTFKYPL